MKLDFLTKNSKLNWFLFGLSILACQIGGGTIIGLSELGYEFGFYSIFGGLGISTGFIFLYLIKKHSSKNNFQTVTQVLASQYKNTKYLKIISILQNISFFLISVGMYVALKNLTTPIFESKLVFYTLWMGIVFIASSGNFRFISKINGFQVLIMFICFGLVFFKLCFYGNLDINYIKFFKLNKTESFAPIRWFLLPFMFTIIGQDMFMNVINTKDKKNVLIGSIFAAFFYTIFCLAIVFIGFIGNELGLKKASVIGNVVLHLTGTLSAGVFFVVIFLAIVTTINAVLNVCSYMTKNDLKLTYKNRDLTIFIGVCIIFIGDKFSEVIYVIHTAYGITSMAIFIPFLMIMLLKNPNTLAAIFSSISGVLGFLYFDIINKDLFLGDLKALIMSILTFAFFQLFLKKS